MVRFPPLDPAKGTRRLRERGWNALDLQLDDLDETLVAEQIDLRYEEVVGRQRSLQATEHRLRIEVLEPDIGGKAIECVDQAERDDDGRARRPEPRALRLRPRVPHIDAASQPWPQADRSIGIEEQDGHEHIQPLEVTWLDAGGIQRKTRDVGPDERRD